MNLQKRPTNAAPPADAFDFQFVHNGVVTVGSGSTGQYELRNYQLVSKPYPSLIACAEAFVEWNNDPANFLGIAPERQPEAAAARVKTVMYVWDTPDGPLPPPAKAPPPKLKSNLQRFEFDLRDVEGETVLGDEYKVYAGYYYVVDDAVVVSDVSGNVRALRRDVIQCGFTANVVKRCNMAARGLL